jgi:hypothetical protein
MADQRKLSPFVYIMMAAFVLIFLSTQANAQTCPAGFYMKNSTSECVPCFRTCAECKPPIFGSVNCTICKTGYKLASFFLWSRTCVCSTAGTFYNSKTLNCTTCSSAIANCVTCSNSDTGTICSTCASGYFRNADNTTCIQCSANCAVCTSATSCTKCKASYYTLTSGSCILQSCSLVKSQCLTCTDTGTTVVCDSCASGYYLQVIAPSNQCAACHTACTNCGPTGCLACSSGYLVSGSTCVTC